MPADKGCGKAQGRQDRLTAPLPVLGAVTTSHGTRLPLQLTGLSGAAPESFARLATGGGLRFEGRTVALES